MEVSSYFETASYKEELYYFVNGSPVFFIKVKAAVPVLSLR